MTPDKMQDAILEATRFIEKAELALKKSVEADWFLPSKETGAARRASMELTRALADLRRRG